jgi:hypothetical protein
VSCVLSVDVCLKLLAIVGTLDTNTAKANTKLAQQAEAAGCKREMTGFLRKVHDLLSAGS